jgi:hypothetical protein
LLIQIVNKKNIFWTIIYVSGGKAATVIRAEKYVQQENKLYFMPALWWFTVWLTFQPGRWGPHDPLKRRLTFNGLYNVVSHDGELFRKQLTLIFDKMYT